MLHSNNGSSQLWADLGGQEKWLDSICLWEGVRTQPAVLNLPLHPSNSTLDKSYENFLQNHAHFFGSTSHSKMLYLFMFNCQSSCSVARLSNCAKKSHCWLCSSLHPQHWAWCLAQSMLVKAWKNAEPPKSWQQWSHTVLKHVTGPEPC